MLCAKYEKIFEGKFFCKIFFMQQRLFDEGTFFLRNTVEYDIKVFSNKKN